MKLKQLLQSKKNGQLWMAMLGTSLGLFLLLIAMQTYFDIQNLIQDKESNFVTVNKKVGLLNMLGGATRFDKDDLKDIEEQPFIKRFAPFSASQFQVMAVVPSIGFRSEFFFESVPNDYLDSKISTFKWSVGDKSLPIIFSRDYLSLYNFGFAPTRGMPALTQSTIKRVGFQIRITSDNGIVDYYNGKVVGFSDRINSILVPQSFLDWANETYSRGQAPAAKIMLEVENPYSKEFKSFIDDNNYELSSGKLIGDKIGNILNIVVAVIGGIGALILVLALLVFLLNFKLMITAASHDIRLLLQLGYKHQTISKSLIKRFVSTLTLTIFIAIVGLFTVRYVALNWLHQQGFEMAFSFHLFTIIAAIAIIVLLFLININAIRRNVIKLG